MVAHPIQDMSEVSIAHKTVDVGLPRLRYGALAQKGGMIRLNLMTGEKIIELFGYENRIVRRFGAIRTKCRAIGHGKRRVTEGNPKVYRSSI
jgi:hypothetical protein